VKIDYKPCRRFPIGELRKWGMRSLRPSHGCGNR
jgi:hypothetical protein